MSKIDDIIKELNKSYKEEIIIKGKCLERKGKKIPFSSPRLNYMLYGGIPRGRIIEFAGEEGGGKTTTALDIVVNAQRIFKQEKEGKKIIYADCENTLDEDWAELLGVNLNDIILMKPQTQTAEQIFDALLSLADTGEAGLIVIDSLGVMLSKQAYEKTMEEKTYGGIAMALTLFSKKMEMLCYKNDCTLIGINQMREDMKSTWGGLVTTGGLAWKHNCSLRLMFKKGAYLDGSNNEIARTAENPHGNLVQVHIVKTKVCKPDRRIGFYTLNYYRGIDKMYDLVDTAIQYEIILKTGSWFKVFDKETGEIKKITETATKVQGISNLIEQLEKNKSLLKFVEDAVNKEMFSV